ncbi:MAG: amidase [Candidatus Rokubacteria bacterium]|nr:amidase [Candidatus Rokubacteria bacterium]
MIADPIFAPLRDLARRLRRGELSPVELAESFLRRLEGLGPRLHAVVTVTRERALTAARRAEAEIAAGHYRGPLHGIPYGAKDLLATAGGIPTTWGAAPLRAQSFDFDATVIRKLEAAGAVLVAKLAMVELAGGMGYRQPSASFTGPGRNPWNPETWTGGSSSGSGAAVAAGLVPFAIGSETWGSILSPAGNCGVTGLRPTYGRVSRHGAMALAWTLDKLGPLGLTADDCGLVLDAIAGPDPADPSATGRAFRYDERDPAGRRFRFGILPAVTEPCEEAVRASFARSLEVLQEIGSVEEVGLPDLPWETVTRTILQAEAASAFEDLIESGGISALTAPEDRAGPYARDAILAKDYIKAMRLRGVMAREIDRVLSRLDLLVAPGRAAVASPIDQEFRSAIRGTVADPMGAIGNGAGLPAVAVPNGLDPRGLPTSLQFMGRAYDENTVLAAARAYQARTDWHRRHPEL